MNVDPAPLNDPKQLVGIRVADAHRIIDESRDVRCSRCGEPIWISPLITESAPTAEMICTQCFASDKLGRQ